MHVDGQLGAHLLHGGYEIHILKHLLENVARHLGIRPGRHLEHSGRRHHHCQGTLQVLVLELVQDRHERGKGRKLQRFAVGLIQRRRDLLPDHRQDGDGIDRLDEVLRELDVLVLRKGFLALHHHALELLHHLVHVPLQVLRQGLQRLEGRLHVDGQLGAHLLHGGYEIHILKHLLENVARHLGIRPGRHLEHSGRRHHHCQGTLQVLVLELVQDRHERGKGRKLQRCVVGLIQRRRDLLPNHRQDGDWVHRLDEVLRELDVWALHKGFLAFHHHAP